jgi:uncharacterized protein
MIVELLRIRGKTNDVAVLQYEPRRSRNVCIVTGHGYSSSKHNLDFLCNFLAAHGYGVYSLDFPGHKLGASGGRLHGLDDLLDAMAAVFAHVREQTNAPTYLMGHSMGAMTALLLAARDSRVAGTIAIATGLGRARSLEALQRQGVIDFRSSYVNGIALPELMQGVDDQLAQALPGLAGRPQLYVAASRDAMVSPRSVEELYDRASQPKTLISIDSDHTYAGENSRGGVLQWLNALHPR